MRAMMKPTLDNVVAIVICACGEAHEFDCIEDGWQHIVPCDCGRRVSVQIEALVQYDTQAVPL